jgi:hypothetical protein
MSIINETSTNSQLLLDQGINIDEVEWQDAGEVETTTINRSFVREHISKKYRIDPDVNEDSVIDLTRWTSLPNEYDKEKGIEESMTITTLVRDKKSKEIKQRVIQSKSYDPYFPKVPTPIIYHKTPIEENKLAKIYAHTSPYQLSSDDSLNRVEHADATLMDVTHDKNTNKLEYHIRLNNGQTIIENILDNFTYLDWPPSDMKYTKDESDIRAFDPKTLKGTKFEYLLVKHPDVAEAHGIPIDDIIHKYTK